MSKFVFNPFTGNFDVVSAQPDEFLAMCTVSEAVDEFVFMNGNDDVRKVDIDYPSNMPAVGVIINKPTSTTCIVQRNGELPLTGLVAGSPFFIGTNSKVTTPRPPDPPSGKRVIQFVGRPRNATTLFLDLTQKPTVVLP